MLVPIWLRWPSYGLLLFGLTCWVFTTEVVFIYLRGEASLSKDLYDYFYGICYQFFYIDLYKVLWRQQLQMHMSGNPYYVCLRTFSLFVIPYLTIFMLYRPYYLLVFGRDMEKWRPVRRSIIERFLGMSFAQVYLMFYA